MFLQLFSIINGVNVSKPQYLSSDWLHTACQVSFIKKYCNLKISSLFRGYLWISPVNIFEQPHGSDQCGYIHLLYRFVCSFTVVEVWPLCRLGCWMMLITIWFIFHKSSSVTRGFLGCFQIYCIQIFLAAKQTAALPPGIRN